jgi:hypothetical protein
LLARFFLSSTKELFSSSSDVPEPLSLSPPSINSSASLSGAPKAFAGLSDPMMSGLPEAKLESFGPEPLKPPKPPVNPLPIPPKPIVLAPMKLELNVLLGGSVAKLPNIDFAVEFSIDVVGVAARAPNPDREDLIPDPNTLGREAARAANPDVGDAVSKLNPEVANAEGEVWYLSLKIRPKVDRGTGSGGFSDAFDSEPGVFLGSSETSCARSSYEEMISKPKKVY